MKTDQTVFMAKLRLKSSINFIKATRLTLLEGKKFVSGIRAINDFGLGSEFPV